MAPAASILTLSPMPSLSWLRLRLLLLLRRYGFHGTSYKYLTAKAAQLLGKSESETNLVICHLGESSAHLDG